VLYFSKLRVISVFLLTIFFSYFTLSNFTKLSIIIISINNFRIGSTYALILEAFKLGS